jgi:hypothetical protein
MSDNPEAFKSAALSLPGPDDITRVELSNGIIVLARPKLQQPLRGHQRVFNGWKPV